MCTRSIQIISWTNAMLSAFIHTGHYVDDTSLVLGKPSAPRLQGLNANPSSFSWSPLLRFAFARLDLRQEKLNSVTIRKYMCSSLTEVSGRQFTFYSCLYEFWQSLYFVYKITFKIALTAKKLTHSGPLFTLRRPSSQKGQEANRMIGSQQSCGGVQWRLKWTEIVG